jgi:multicomponent Na+:H+ antiporter subunit D
VLLGGIVSKIAGVYGLYVLTGMFGGVEAVSASLAVVGLLSIVVGALLAHEQTDFKRIIAYSSVSQTGYILLGLCAGNMIGLIGTLVYIFSHAVFKSTLFANAAALQSQTGELEVDKLGGLQSKMPVTAVSSVVAFLSTAGIPPFAGFWGKLLIIIALWSPGTRVLSAAALCASILTAAYMLRLQKKVFFGKTPQHLQAVTEIGGSIKYAEILLTAVTGAVGVLFPFVLVYLRSKGFM